MSQELNQDLNQEFKLQAQKDALCQDYKFSFDSSLDVEPEGKKLENLLEKDNSLSKLPSQKKGKIQNKVEFSIMSRFFKYCKSCIFDYFCFEKKYLTFNLVSRNLKVKYGRSVFGLLWTLISPMILAMIYYLVFKKVMKVQMPRYLTFTLSGVIAWSFFAQCVLESMESLVGNRGLISKIPLPLQVFPLSNLLTNFITLLAAFVVVVGVAWMQSVMPGSYLLWAFVLSFQLFLIAYSMGLALAIGFVYFKDLKHIATLFLQFWMYATPVFYSLDMVDEPIRIWFSLNPLTDTFMGIHHCFTQGTRPSIEILLKSTAWTLVFTFIGIFCFQKPLKKVPENI